MRAFLVTQGEIPIAVVFHDYGTGDLYCRSVVRSFAMAFDAECSKRTVSFKKEGSRGEVLRAVSSGARVYDWARSVLDQLCDGFWNCKDLGTVVSTESSIDAVIRKHLI
jgi:hypothetical protein